MNDSIENCEPNIPSLIISKLQCYQIKELKYLQLGVHVCKINVPKVCECVDRTIYLVKKVLKSLIFLLKL